MADDERATAGCARAIEESSGFQTWIWIWVLDLGEQGLLEWREAL